MADEDDLRRDIGTAIKIAVPRYFDSNASALARAAGVSVSVVHSYRIGSRRPRLAEIASIKDAIKAASAGASTIPVRFTDFANAAVEGLIESTQHQLAALDILSNPQLETVCIDNEGCCWLSDGTWELKEVPRLTRKALNEVANKLSLICHDDLDAPRSLVRGSLNIPTSIGERCVRFTVIRRPISSDGNCKISLRMPRQEVSSDLHNIIFDVQEHKPRPELIPICSGPGLLDTVKDIIKRRRRILLNGPCMYERIELLDTICQMLPRDKRVVVLENARGFAVGESVLPPNHVRLRFDGEDTEHGFRTAALAAETLRPDYLIIPEADDIKPDEYLADVGYSFAGQIFGYCTFLGNKPKSIDELGDLIITTIDRRAAPPVGISEVRVRCAKLSADPGK